MGSGLRVHGLIQLSSVVLLFALRVRSVAANGSTLKCCAPLRQPKGSKEPLETMTRMVVFENVKHLEVWSIG